MFKKWRTEKEWAQNMFTRMGIIWIIIVIILWYKLVKHFWEKLDYNSMVKYYECSNNFKMQLTDLEYESLIKNINFWWKFLKNDGFNEYKLQNEIKKWSDLHKFLTKPNNYWEISIYLFDFVFKHLPWEKITNIKWINYYKSRDAYEWIRENLLEKRENKIKKCNSFRSYKDDYKYVWYLKEKFISNSKKEIEKQNEKCKKHEEYIKNTNLLLYNDYLKNYRDNNIDLAWTTPRTYESIINDVFYSPKFKNCFYGQTSIYTTKNNKEKDYYYIIKPVFSLDSIYDLNIIWAIWLEKTQEIQTKKNAFENKIKELKEKRETEKEILTKTNECITNKEIYQENEEKNIPFEYKNLMTPNRFRKETYNIYVNFNIDNIFYATWYYYMCIYAWTKEITKESKTWEKEIETIFIIKQTDWFFYEEIFNSSDVYFSHLSLSEKKDKYIEKIKELSGIYD